jgi:hypothetical protein
VNSVSEGKRRIDRINQPEFVDDLDGLDLAVLRERRDECREELEHLSMLRRYVQSRAEILKGELARRHGDGAGSLLDNLAEILSAEDHPSSSRGGAIRLHVPDDEMLLARRRVEKLVADSGVTDPGSLSDTEIDQAVANLKSEEHAVSADRAEVIRVLDTLQDELKRRFKDDPASVLA